jgi:hypothetical protein
MLMSPMPPGVTPVLAAPAVHQIQQRVAHALDGGDVQFHRAGLVVEAPGAQFQRALVGHGGILHADRDRAHRRAVLAREALRKGVLLGVDDEIDVALAVQGHILGAVAGDGGEAHLSNSAPSAFGSGAAYSTNSKPSVPIGFSQGVNCMCVS